MERVRRLLFGHPLVKTIGLGLFGLLGNVLAGAYIFEIRYSTGQRARIADPFGCLRPCSS